MDGSHATQAKSDDHSDSSQDESISHNRRNTGAVKRRIKWWIREGKSISEAEELALKPYHEIPEYFKIQKAKNAKMLKKKRKANRFKIHKGIYLTLMGIKGKKDLLNEKQLKTLKSRVKEIGRGEDPWRCCDCYSRCGIFIIKCADEDTVNWFTAIFPTLNPVDQAQLILLDEREIKYEISLFFRRKQTKDRKISASVEGNISDDNEQPD